MMIIINGTIRLPAANLERARPVMRAVIEATRKEDGCLSYAFAEDVLEPGLIHVVESWRDQAALDAHFGAPHFTVWREANPGLEVSDRHIVIYDATHLKTL
jgi:quinol monooxygenase YgiN